MHKLDAAVRRREPRPRSLRLLSGLRITWVSTQITIFYFFLIESAATSCCPECLCIFSFLLSIISIPLSHKRNTYCMCAIKHLSCWMAAWRLWILLGYTKPAVVCGQFAPESRGAPASQTIKLFLSDLKPIRCEVGRLLGGLRRLLATRDLKFLPRRTTPMHLYV